ncbi:MULTISPECIES: isocitrate lyase/PEP mutase family protein [unclassified Pseudovibrio]|uniref:isocitrate lyase/PEP mutase family protein n=1 Tax=unclassified Pseudovibrio TaxID=2627060 RepID=UPI0007AEE0BA|nr:MULTISPECIES: isocitrate lyase/PEP mutase family protein [unclassified Pseudovibrio]KZL03639.1 2,3-dimethylmalate lyase [Pseudovibrio sp. W74]KZL09647.1 2,3-dimethylmalate lyase [Pseudovibrio sp. Ad14]
MSKAQVLKDLFESGKLNVTPCCWDALSARLIEQAGFPLAFMSGFGVSAARLGQPDAGLISYAEMVDQARNIAGATDIPVIGDGDTGYGNALNVKRTVKGYANAGMACVMIEDQLAPKRCGHTKGKHVVDREEAFMRIRAAVDAKNEGADILVLARTDARAEHGLDEAIERAKTFREIGADMTFVEAPRTVEEMKRYCDEVEGPKMANMLEGGLTPFLQPVELQELGFAISTYPFTGLMGMIKAQQEALDKMKRDIFSDPAMTFEDLQKAVGFDAYYEAEERYRH